MPGDDATTLNRKPMRVIIRNCAYFYIRLTPRRHKDFPESEYKRRLIFLPPGFRV
jgi:hypothetical protein